MRKSVLVVVVFCVLIAGAGAAPTLDQHQDIYTTNSQFTVKAGQTTWSQSFTSGTTGLLTQIDIGFFGNINGDGELSVYAGDGINGLLLDSVVSSVFSEGIVYLSPSYNSFSIEAAVIAGQKYTFKFEANPITFPDVYYVACSALDSYEEGYYTTYPSGDASPGTIWARQDALFRSYVDPDIVAAPIPAPSALLLSSIGVGCVSWYRRRRTL